MPVVLRSETHPAQRVADRVNPERLLTLLGQLEERLIATAETMQDQDLADAFSDFARRVELIHHDVAILLF
jgi:hypothetical protein